MKPAEIILQQALVREGFTAPRHGYSIIVYDDKLEAFIHVHNLHRTVTLRFYRFGDTASHARIRAIVERVLEGYRIEASEVP